LILLLISSLRSAGQPNRSTVQEIVWCLTEVMYHDGINPPAAARFYSYCFLAGYETASQLELIQQPFQKKIRNYPELKLKINSNSINKDLAVLYAILETGKTIIPSGHLLKKKQIALLDKFKNIDKAVLDSSISLATGISKFIVQFSAQDGYFHLSALQRYTPLEGEGNWKPTPPEFMAAVEPKWSLVKTFFLDSPQQFKTPVMTEFDIKNNSEFLKMVKQVFDISNSLSEEQKLIANFWDCNPFAVQFQGHMSIGLKKISPGAHWIGIAGIATNQSMFDLGKTITVHTLLAMTIHDGFVACWGEKFSTNRIRPETAINRYIDEKWQPLLQTPPFPEFPSGHSVISTAAAEVLTSLLGEEFAFSDTVETYFGLPPRNFRSFHAAASEACMSRLYGGIHFLDAIENGATTGKEIGKCIIRQSGIGKLN
jgi:hypothetical protein